MPLKTREAARGSKLPVKIVDKIVALIAQKAQPIDLVFFSSENRLPQTKSLMAI